MTLPSDLPAELAHRGVRPADRLGFTLFLAALIHLALLLGVGFTMVEPKQISKTLEITLATFKSETKPKKADFLAQENQEGSGTLDKKAIPKTTEVAPFQDNQVKKVTPPPAAKPEVREAAPKAAVTTVAPKQQKAPTKKKKPGPRPNLRSTRRRSTARSCPATSPASKRNWPTNSNCTPSARAFTV